MILIKIDQACLSAFFFCRILQYYFMSKMHMSVSRYYQLKAKLRRFFIIHFRPGYLKKQHQMRRGHCRQCGLCCSLFVRCPFFTSDHLCRVYGKCRPKVCKVYPIDQRDIDEIAALGGQCGYSFDTSSDAA